MLVKGTLSSYANSWTSRGGIPSAPVALEALIFFKTEYTFHGYKYGGKYLAGKKAG